MQTIELVLVIGIVAALVSAAAAALHGPRRIRGAPTAESESGDGVKAGAIETIPSFGEMLRHTLRRDLALAAEHVYSIRSLLEIARQHQQPIPHAALTNLNFVSKHLAEMQRRIQTAAEEPAPEVLNAFGHAPKG